MKHLLQIETRLSLLVLAFFFAGITFADDFKYSDSWGKQGFSLKTQKTSGVEVNYSISNFSLSKDLINGIPMDAIGLPGTLLPNNEGAPNLPGDGRYVAIPQGATVHYKVISSRTEKFSNIELAPAFKIPWANDDNPLVYNQNMDIYSKNEFYPANPVILSEVTQVRGVDAVILGVTPFQYNPVTKELIVYRDLKIEVTFEGGTGHFGEDRLRSRWWDPMLSDMLLNYESLPKMDYNKSFQSKDETGCEYLIISPTGADFLQWADSIKEFRTLQGIKTEVVTLSEIGANNAITIENYINNAYNTWDIPPAAILLFGDYGTNIANSVIAPIYNSYCVSDNIYGDVNADQMPDIITARMTANNATQLQTMVTKFINYERNPPTDPDFYAHPMTCMGYQTERWFQICTESVAGFWEQELGKTTNRVNAIYNGTPTSGPWSTATNTTTVVNYFGPNGLGYIPATPGQVNCSWNGTGNNVVTGINNGAFILLHRDHGAETLWGEPDFSNSHINNLTNTDLTYIWSVNCLTGKYNYSGECMVEKLHRHTSGGNNAGALGAIGDSEVSYSFVNDAFVWGAFDNMWPNFMPAYGTNPESRGLMPGFANAAGKYFLQQSSWPYNTTNKEVTYNLFHHHGDAFLNLYSEIPQNLTVVHNPILYAGVTNFDVTANEGAFIALTVNGEIIATATATSGPLSITVPPQQPPDQMLVTITMQNYYRYTSFVEVIPPAGPYIVQNAVEINDASGNGNGMMETSESIMASITVENVGIEDATNVIVNIASADEFVSITDNTETYGTIVAGATAVIVDGFAWEVADNIPDMYTVVFEMIATDGNATWITYFSVVGHGPVLEVGSLMIDDSQGNNNGRLDPGETAIVLIPTYNNGSYDAMGTIGNLSCSSGFITLNNSAYNFNVLGAGLMEEAAFNLTVAPNAPIGTGVSFMYDVTSGGYNQLENFGATIGLIVEDWETGDLSQFNWLTGGTTNWAVSTVNPYEGSYSIKSGSLGNSQSNYLSLQYEIFGADSISFWYKVSSEASYDFLKFYVDNILKSSWSGEVGWAREAIAVTAGMHTFKWEYSKDVSVAGGSDCAWLDFIVLPAPPMTTAYAGQDGSICEDDTYSCNGTASLYNLVNWTTSGNGTFDNSQVLNPVYTPGTGDITNGSVVLTLTAYGPENDVTDNMTLTIHSAPVANAGQDELVCSNATFELMYAMAENYVSVNWTTSGDGTYNDANIINPVYTPGNGDIAAGSVTLMFEVNGNPLCGYANDDLILTFEPAAMAFAGENTETCSNVPLALNASADNYTLVEWATSGDGTFDNNAILNAVYTPGVNDAVTGSVTLTLSAMGNGPCEVATSEMMLTINAVAMAFAGEDHQINSDETYTIADATVANAFMVSWTTSGDGTFDDASSVNPTYTPGINDIAAEQATLTLTAGNEDCGEVSDNMTLVVNTSGVDENTAGFDISISPNPNNGSFTVELSGDNNEVIAIRIYNAQSRLVYETENIQVNKNFNQTIQMNVEKGIYFIRLEGKELRVNRKLIINK